MKNKYSIISIDEQIEFIKQNYSRFYCDLLKFDMFKRSKAKKAPFIPSYYLKDGKKYMIVNHQRMECNCSDISGLIQLYLKDELEIDSKVVYGRYRGSGEKYSDSKFNSHAWIELSDGTIVDGSYEQYQPKSKKNPIQLKIIRPDNKLYKNWEKSEWKEPEIQPLPYIIEARARKFSLTQLRKEYQNWHGKKGLKKILNDTSQMLQEAYA